MNTVEKAKENKSIYEDKLTDYTNILRSLGNKEKLIELSEMRRLPLGVLEKSGVFYVADMGEMIIPKYLNMIGKFGVISPTNNKPIFSNRWVIPILTSKGKVQNLVGYSNVADERYVYGKAQYYLRRDTLYGLENIRSAHELGYAALTEGITDTLRLRSLGILNSFAMCGTHKSDKIISQLGRLRYGVINIPDRDDAGESAVKNWVTNRYVTLHVHLSYKDVDEMLREEENESIFMEYFKECVRWLRTEEHRGYKHSNKVMTII